MTKKSVKSQTPRMSRIVTSVASFSWQRAAVWRACSSGVRSVSLASSSKSVRSLLGRRIETQARDCVGDAPREHIVDRLVACDARANLRRGDRNGVHLELDDPVVRGEPLADGRDVVARQRPDAWRPQAERARGRALGTSSSRSCELVRAEDEESILAVAAPRESRRCERGDRARRSPREHLRTRAARARAVSPQVSSRPCGPDRRPRTRAARRGRAGRRPLVRVRHGRDAADRRRLRECLLPLELLLADLDLRARLDAETPKGFLELLGRRRRPDDAVAAIGA